MDQFLEGSLGLNPTQHVVTALATGIGAFGGFPAGPKIFQDWTANPLFQWAMVFILIWQGGGGADFEFQDIMVSAFVTVLLYFATYFLDYNYSSLKMMGM